MPLPSHRPFVPRALALAARLAMGMSLGLGLATSAHAQNLQELYQAAHDYDAAYLSARASLDAAQYRLDQRKGLRLPTVGLGLTAGRQISNTPDGETGQANVNQAGAQVTGSQTIYNRGNDVVITQAQKLVDVSRSDLDAAEQDLILRVSQAYFDVLAAQDNLATARASQAAISEQVASAKRNFEVGTATITDTREAQARFDLARFTQIQAENDLLTKRILLDQTVGRANVAPKPLAVPVVVPALSPSNPEEWVQRADAEHPAIRKARLALEVAKLDTEGAKAQNLPTVTLNGSYGRYRQDTRGTIPTSAIPPSAENPGLPAGTGFAFNGPSTSGQIGITVNIPLFAGYQIQNRIKETLVLEDKSQADLDSARRQVAQATRTLFYGVGSGAAQVSALEAAESSSQLALEATQLGFKVGVRVNIDVLNAQAQLYTTQAQLAAARYNLIMSGLRLRQASGHLTGDDVAAVNGLLVR